MTDKGSCSFPDGEVSMVPLVAEVETRYRPVFLQKTACIDAIFLQICECIGKRILADIHSSAVNQKRLQAMIGIASVGDGIGTAFIDFQITVRDFSVFRTGCNTMDISGRVASYRRKRVVPMMADAIRKCPGSSWQMPSGSTSKAS